MSAITIKHRKGAVTAQAPPQGTASLLLLGLVLVAGAFIAFSLTSQLSAILAFVTNVCADFAQSLLAAYAGV
ncbi:MAG: hypothetical protein ACREA9_10945 [Pyrinomonadaceae bacterium]